MVEGRLALAVVEALSGSRAGGPLVGSIEHCSAELRVGSEPGGSERSLPASPVGVQRGGKVTLAEVGQDGPRAEGPQQRAQAPEPGKRHRPVQFLPEANQPAKVLRMDQVGRYERTDREPLVSTRSGQDDTATALFCFEDQSSVSRVPDVPVRSRPGGAGIERRLEQVGATDGFVERGENLLEAEPACDAFLDVLLVRGICR